MALVREEIIDGVLYRITEDEETGFVLKELIHDNEPREPEPNLTDRVAQLEDENAFIAMELVNTQIRLDLSEQELAASKNDMLDTMDALFDVYLLVLELQSGGGSA